MLGKLIKFTNVIKLKRTVIKKEKHWIFVKVISQFKACLLSYFQHKIAEINCHIKMLMSLIFYKARDLWYKRDSFTLCEFRFFFFHFCDIGKP